MRNNYGQQVALFVLNWFTRPPLLQPPPSPRTKRMLLWRLRPSWASTRSTTCRPRGRRGTHDLSGLGLGFLQSSRISAHFSAMSRPTLCMACSSECPYAPHADWWLQPVLCPFHVSFPFFPLLLLLFPSFFPFFPFRYMASCTEYQYLLAFPSLDYQDMQSSSGVPGLCAPLTGCSEFEYQVRNPNPYPNPNFHP